MTFKKRIPIFDIMTTAQNIRNQILAIREGEIFGYPDFALKPNQYLAAAKAVERFIDNGEIRRLSRGLFYKPKTSLFGELEPNQEEFLKRYLFKDGKQIGYITGNYLYKKLGLTTQIPSVIHIARSDKQIRFSNEVLKIVSVKSYVNINNSNIHLLEFLDVLKDFTTIPDLDKNTGISFLLNKVNSFNRSDIRNLVSCGLAYPPRVRAFLGALLEKNDLEIDLNPLEKSLNPFSQFDYGIKDLLITASNWQLK